MSLEMKAAVFKGPEDIDIETVKKPLIDDSSIIVKIEACGICGSDIRNYHKGLRHGVKSQIMGHEIGGLVTEVGALVKDFDVGEKVAIAPDVSCGKCYYCEHGFVNLCNDHRMLGTHWPGGFAQFIKIPDVVLKRGMVHKMPEGISFEEATLAEPLSSVITSQKEAPVELGDTVLVLGDGPIGCLHLEIARARGAFTIIMAGLNKLDLAKRFEPDLLIDASKKDPVEEALRFTDGLGADIAVCANPVASTQEQAVRAVRKRGKVILFGGLSKDDPITKLNSNLIHYNELSIVGAFSYPAYMNKLALEVIKNKKITTEKYIDMILPLEEIKRGFVAAETGKALKVIIKPWLEKD
jgi:L-iditol 2-dehydrogenase